MNLDKKAQLTFAIVIGLVLLGIFIVFILISYGDRVDYDDPELVKKELEVYMQNCMKYNAETALFYIGLYGGYIEPTGETIEKFNQEIVYLRKNNIPLPITDDIVKEQLSSYIEDTMQFCNKVFNSYEKHGYYVDTGKFNAQISFNELDTTLMINYLITITQSGVTESLDSFTFKIPVSMRKILDTSSLIVNNEDIDITLLNDLSIKTTVLPYEDALVYVLEDKGSILLNQPYKFMFAVS